MSPFLFLLVILTAASSQWYKYRTNQTCLNNLDFADDFSLLAETRVTLREMMTNLEREAEKDGLGLVQRKQLIHLFI